MESFNRVVFDLNQLLFVDRPELESLLSCLRQVNPYSGDLKLRGMTKPVQTLSELVQMNRVFDTYNNKTEAMLAFLQ